MSPARIQDQAPRRRRKRAARSEREALARACATIARDTLSRNRGGDNFLSTLERIVRRAAEEDPKTPAERAAADAAISGLALGLERVGRAVRRCPRTQTCAAPAQPRSPAIRPRHLGRAYQEPGPDAPFQDALQPGTGASGPGSAPLRGSAQGDERGGDREDGGCPVRGFRVFRGSKRTPAPCVVCPTGPARAHLPVTPPFSICSQSIADKQDRRIRAPHALPPRLIWPVHAGNDHYLR